MSLIKEQERDILFGGIFISVVDGCFTRGKKRLQSFLTSEALKQKFIKTNALFLLLREKCLFLSSKRCINSCVFFWGGAGNFDDEESDDRSICSSCWLLETNTQKSLFICKFSWFLSVYIVVVIPQNLYNSLNGKNIVNWPILPEKGSHVYKVTYKLASCKSCTNWCSINIWSERRKMWTVTHTHWILLKRNLNCLVTTLTFHEVTTQFKGYKFLQFALFWPLANLVFESVIFSLKKGIFFLYKKTPTFLPFFSKKKIQ